MTYMAVVIVSEDAIVRPSYSAQIMRAASHTYTSKCFFLENCNSCKRSSGSSMQWCCTLIIRVIVLVMIFMTISTWT